MPFTFTEDARKQAVQSVLEGLANGTPLTVICRADGMPCDDTIRKWADADPELARAIARAREAGHDQIALDAMRIVDDTTEDPASRRVRADTRLKLLAKWDPKRYGEMIKHAGHDGGALDLAATVNLARERALRG